MNKNYLDISMEIKPEMTVYKNRAEKRPKIDIYADHRTKDFQQSAICMDMHTGTHIDMPLHMIDSGDDSSAFDIARVCGSCRVLSFANGLDKITADDLQAKEIGKGEIVLLKTKNSFSDAFLDDFTYLAESGAALLAKLGVRAVGIDALGIERAQDGHPTHKILLGEGVPIIEGLRLADVAEGTYELVCLPLRIAGVEGLPARAVLFPL